MKKKQIIALFCCLAIFISSIARDFSKGNESDDMKGGDRFLQAVDQLKLDEKVIEEGDSENRILVIPVHGTISGQESYPPNDTYSHSLLLLSLKKAEEDPTIKGVLLDINSPGGYVYQSSEAWQRILEFKERTKKPVYTSMGQVCASGGYYIAAASDKIFASEETTTGSIGVISQYTNMSGLFEKLGVSFSTFKSGEYKDMGSSHREMTEDEKKIVQEDIDAFYNKFVRVVSQGRNMSEEDVRALATGRTYTGLQASKNGLVDEIGYQKEALDSLAQACKIKNPQVFQYNKATNFYQDLLGLSSNLAMKNSESAVLYNLAEKLYQNQGQNYMYLYGGE